MRRAKVLHLDIIDYKKSWDFQEKLNQRMVNAKIWQRKNPDKEPPFRYNWLIFCQHPAVFTLGKSGSFDHLLLSQEELQSQNIQFYKINRGGDITHHGPQQLVVYPIFDLEQFFTDIHKYLRTLEEAVILTLQQFNIRAGRYEGYTGVWIEPENELRARKICAMGIRTSRWVTMHGLALNVNNNLNYFNQIVPCGIEDKAVTSIEKELGKKVNFAEVESVLLKNLTSLFHLKLD